MSGIQKGRFQAGFLFGKVVGNPCGEQDLLKSFWASIPRMLVLPRLIRG